MAYGRIHDEAASNGKLLALSDAAWRMWGNGLIYCQVNLTDGFIPSHAIHTFGVRARNKTKVAADLCAPQIPGKAPLWVAVDGGFQIHDYLDWNDAAEVIKKKRRLAKHRFMFFQNTALRKQLRARDGSQCRYCGVAVNWADRRGPLGATYDHVDPDGPPTLDNLVVSCRGCNSSKGGRTPEEADISLRPAPRSDLNRNPDRNLDTNQKIPRSQQETTTTTTTTRSQIRTEGVISRTEDGADTEHPPALWRRLWEARWPEGICRTSQAELTELERLAAQLGSAELTARIERYVATDDTWLVDHKHPLGTFLRQINSYDGAKDMPAGRAEAVEAAKALKRVLWSAVGRDGRVWLESAIVTQDGATVQLETTTPEKLAPYHDAFLEAVREELGGDVELAIVAAEAGGV